MKLCGRPASCAAKTAASASLRGVCSQFPHPPFVRVLFIGARFGAGCVPGKGSSASPAITASSSCRCRPQGPQVERPVKVASPHCGRSLRNGGEPDQVVLFCAGVALALGSTPSATAIHVLQILMLRRRAIVRFPGNFRLHAFDGKYSTDNQLDPKRGADHEDRKLLLLLLFCYTVNRNGEISQSQRLGTVSRSAHTRADRWNARKEKNFCQKPLQEKQLGADPHGVTFPTDRPGAWLHAICRCSPRCSPRVRSEGSSSAFPIRFLFFAFQMSLPCLGFAPRSQDCIPQLPAAVARASATPVFRVYSRACRILRPTAGAAVRSPRITAASAAVVSMTCTPSFPSLPSSSNVIVSTCAPFVGG